MPNRSSYYERDYDRDRRAVRWEDEEDRRRFQRDERGHEDRGFMDRAGDEVRSWFGDEEAERRRRMDERKGYTGGSYGSRFGPSSDRERYGREDWSTGRRYGQTWGTDDRYESAWQPEYPWPRERGRYSGRGPSGYQRSDERIREDVNDRLTDHPDIDATNVRVEVSGGEVRLEGTVENRKMKRIAEDIAESVGGVKDVQNLLRVSPETGSRSS